MKIVTEGFRASFSQLSGNVIAYGPANFSLKSIDIRARHLHQCAERSSIL